MMTLHKSDLIGTDFLMKSDNSMVIDGNLSSSLSLNHLKDMHQLVWPLEFAEFSNKDRFILEMNGPQNLEQDVWTRTLLETSLHGLPTMKSMDETNMIRSSELSVLSTSSFENNIGFLQLQDENSSCVCGLELMRNPHRCQWAKALFEFGPFEPPVKPKPK